MKLCEMGAGDRAVVVQVDTDGATKERLRSLNVRAGSKLILLKVSLLRRTYFLQAASARLAVSREIAERITVGRIEE